MWGDNMAKITKERKVTYYIGIGMVGIGFILFISVFFSAASFMNDPFGGSGIPPFTNSVIGMVFMIAGSVVMNIGAKGAAGSGLLLDPDKAREDLKPFNEAKGGMINDVISNIDAVDQITNSKETREVIKIELHHIKQEADGGENSFENCIPLCFDCHSDVKTYNPKHPKGRKYTEKELISHRNSWYEKVKQSGGITGNPDYQDIDRKTYEKLKSILQSDMMIWLNENNFAGFSFKLDNLDPIREFIYECEKPEFEFIDIDLEGLKHQLCEKTKKFSRLIGKYTFPNGDGWNSIPSDWEIEYPERFDEVVDQIHTATSEIWEGYCELIKLSRRKLLV
jgi:hypothetical protein